MTKKQIWGRTTTDQVLRDSFAAILLLTVGEVFGRSWYWILLSNQQNDHLLNLSVHSINQYLLLQSQIEFCRTGNNKVLFKFKLAACPFQSLPNSSDLFASTLAGLLIPDLSLDPPSAPLWTGGISWIEWRERADVYSE